jgi:hypothetical protein
MPLLPATGTQLSYNGVTFDGSTRVKLQNEYVSDDANRTTVYQRVTLTARAIVAVQGGTNTTLEEMRHKLGASGGALVFTGHGFGSDLTINTVQGKRDVKWGPHPKVLSWESIGSYNACEVEWQVVTCITPCAQSPSTGIMAINYDVAYKIDDRGYTKRVIDGYVEIAQTRDGRSVPATADAYRDVIAPTLPEGFAREQDWNLSLDKSRLDFSITDSEIPSPNPYPVGVVKISGSHRMRVPKSMATSKCSLTTRIEMARDQPVSLAYAIFSTIVTDRLNLLIAAGKKFIIDDLSIEEELFSREVSCSINYRLLSKISNLLQDSTLWTPLGTDWTLWQVSMQNCFRNRGHAGLAHLAANDAIVDLCGGQGTIAWNAQQNLVNTQLPQPQTTLKNQQPAPDQSWLKYRSQIVTGRDRPVIRQAVLQTPDNVSLSTSPNDTGGLDFGQSGGTDDVLQQSGRSRLYASLVGSAMRAGYPIPKPSVTAIGSQTPVEASAKFVQQIISNSLGIPIYGAAWTINYLLPNSPGTVKPPANPMEGVDESGTSVQPN